MVLPEINTIVGGHTKPRKPIHDELTANYARISSQYWFGVEERKKAYRRAVINEGYERAWKRLDTMAKCELGTHSEGMEPHSKGTASPPQSQPY
jgi:hypothetical protein